MVPEVVVRFTESMTGAGRVVGVGRGDDVVRRDVFVDVLDVDLVDVLVEDVLDDVTFDDDLDEVLVEEVLEDVTDETVSLNTARMAYCPTDPYGEYPSILTSPFPAFITLM